MKLSDYDYRLPKELIAQKPAKYRHKSKLMVVNKKEIEHKTFSDIISYLKKDDVLVLNNTKVIKAKIECNKQTGGKIDGIISGEKNGLIEAILRGKLSVGTLLEFRSNIKCEIVEKNGGAYKLKCNTSFIEITEKIGSMPLPPYIKEKSDPSRYQTTYAQNPGAIAAPTAGLHFTKLLLDKMRKRGIKICYITLHVGYGTFNPIRDDDFTKHKMHQELYEIPKESADQINERKGRLFVVGTTSLKTLESAADKTGQIIPKKAWSDLFIYPGYKFRTKTNGLITNFHLPKSTLMLLVSAYYGRDNIMHAYKEAIKNNYRFFSFGDAMLLNSQPQ